MARLTSKIDEGIFSANSEDAGKRWAASLRRRYPADTAKRIARDFDVYPRTARAWLSGQAPQVKVLIRAWHLHGFAIIAEVLAPSAEDATEMALRSDLQALGSRLEDLRLKLEAAPDE